MCTVSTNLFPNCNTNCNTDSVATSSSIASTRTSTDNTYHATDTAADRPASASANQSACSRANSTTDPSAVATAGTCANQRSFSTTFCSSINDPQTNLEYLFTNFITNIKSYLSAHTESDAVTNINPDSITDPTNNGAIELTY